MKAENQNFPQMTRIRVINWYLRSRINLWHKNKFTNLVLSLCWQMSKFTVWYFDLPISISTYHCIHLSKNGGSKVVLLLVMPLVEYFRLQAKRGALCRSVIKNTLNEFVPANYATGDTTNSIWLWVTHKKIAFNTWIFSTL